MGIRPFLPTESCTERMRWALRTMCSALQSDWAWTRKQQLTWVSNREKRVHEQRHLSNANRSSASLGQMPASPGVISSHGNETCFSSGHHQSLWVFWFHAKEIKGSICSAFNLEVNLLRREIVNLTADESIFLCIYTAGRTKIAIV